MRILLSTLCLILLALTSVQAAAARGHAPAAGTIVICTGHGPVMIAVDADGQPTGDLIACPEFAMALSAPLPDTAQPPQRTDIWRPMYRTHNVAQPTYALQAPANARAPPLF